MNYKLRIKGNSTEINCSEDETILDCLEKHGFYPNSSCRIGVCSVCKSLLKKGSVEHDEGNCLTEHELNNKVILTCASYLKSDCDIIL